MSNLTILPRSAWNARPPVRPRSMRPRSSIHELFVHWPGALPATWQYTNTKGEEAQTIRGFQYSHMTRPNDPFIDIGYNHVMGNGGFGKEVPRIWTARGAQFLPAAQLNHNPGTMAICVLMGPRDPLTQSIVDRLRSYVRWVIEYSGNDIRVRPHGAVVDTECPGGLLRSAISAGRLTNGIARARV